MDPLGLPSNFMPQAGGRSRSRLVTSVVRALYGCFCKFRALSVEVLRIRALAFGVYVRSTDSWKLTISDS